MFYPKGSLHKLGFSRCTSNQDKFLHMKRLYRWYQCSGGFGLTSLVKQFTLHFSCDNMQELAKNVLESCRHCRGANHFFNYSPPPPHRYILLIKYCFSKLCQLFLTKPIHLILHSFFTTMRSAAANNAQDKTDTLSVLVTYLANSKHDKNPY